MKFSNGIKSALPVAVLGVLALGLAPTPAFATTGTATMTVSTTIAATCTITATPIAFGTYTGVVSQATGSVTVTCTNTTPYDVGLNEGTATGATTANRSMANGATLLNYDLFTDSARTHNWGNIVDTDTVEMTGTGLGQTLTVYGQISAGQYFSPGLYTDTITATVTY